MPAPRNLSIPPAVAGAAVAARAVEAGTREVRGVVAVMVAAPARRGRSTTLGGVEPERTSMPKGVQGVDGSAAHVEGVVRLRAITGLEVGAKLNDGARRPAWGARRGARDHDQSMGSIEEECSVYDEDRALRQHPRHGGSARHLRERPAVRIVVRRTCRCDGAARLRAWRRRIEDRSRQANRKLRFTAGRVVRSPQNLF